MNKLIILCALVVLLCGCGTSYTPEEAGRRLVGMGNPNITEEIANGNLEVAKLWVASGKPQKNQYNKNFAREFITAVRNGHEDIAIYLIQNGACDPSAVVYAVQLRQYDVVKEAMKYSPYGPDRIMVNGRMSIYQYVQETKDKRMIEIMDYGREQYSLKMQNQ